LPKPCCSPIFPAHCRVFSAGFDASGALAILFGGRSRPPSLAWDYKSVSTPRFGLPYTKVWAPSSPRRLIVTGRSHCLFFWMFSLDASPHPADPRPKARVWSPEGRSRCLRSCLRPIKPPPQRMSSRNPAAAEATAERHQSGPDRGSSPPTPASLEVAH